MALTVSVAMVGMVARVRAKGKYFSNCFSHRLLPIFFLFILFVFCLSSLNVIAVRYALRTEYSFVEFNAVK